MRLAEATLHRIALAALTGVGDDVAGQWEEMGDKAFHVRRRLTTDEQLLVGDVVDIRGTDEVARRLRPVRHLLPAGWAA